MKKTIVTALAVMMLIGCADQNQIEKLNTLCNEFAFQSVIYGHRQARLGLSEDETLEKYIKIFPEKERYLLQYREETKK